MNIPKRTIAIEFVSNQIKQIKERLGDVQYFDTKKAVDVVVEFLEKNQFTNIDLNSYESIIANTGLSADIIGAIYKELASSEIKLSDATRGIIEGANFGELLATEVKKNIASKKLLLKNKKKTDPKLELIELQIKAYLSRN